LGAWQCIPFGGEKKNNKDETSNEKYPDFSPSRNFASYDYLSLEGLEGLESQESPSPTSQWLEND